jgi:hypothetical protein
MSRDILASCQLCGQSTRALHHKLLLGLDLQDGLRRARLSGHNLSVALAFASGSKNLIIKTMAGSSMPVVILIA